MSGDQIVWGIPLGQMQEALVEHEARGFELQEVLLDPDGKAVMWFSPVQLQLVDVPPSKDQLNLGPRRRPVTSDWSPIRFEPGMLPAGIYRHYKGPLYLVLGLAHDADAGQLYDEPHQEDPEPLGERVVVVYVGLQLDAAKEGPRLAVRTLEYFNEPVCSRATHAHLGGVPAHEDCEPRRRFEYVGAVYNAGMENQ